jgi:hypothetical protein
MLLGNFPSDPAIQEGELNHRHSWTIAAVGENGSEINSLIDSFSFPVNIMTNIGRIGRGRNPSVVMISGTAI